MNRNAFAEGRLQSACENLSVVLPHAGEQYLLSGRAYQMVQEHPEDAQGDSDWWEYRIDFSYAQTGAARLEWDSFHETYNGAVAQRLDRDGAMSALAEFFRECTDEELMADLLPEK